MKKQELAAMIDQTLLSQTATAQDVEKFCREAVTYEFASVCINPVYVPLAYSILKGTKTKVCTVIDFPLGAGGTDLKKKDAVDDKKLYEMYYEYEEKVCEIVFNTSMAGYQEILSDPSYTYQAVVMTYPLIGNYGMAADDYETAVPSIGALIVHEVNDDPSNFRCEKTLDAVMKKFSIPGIYGPDTRKLTRFIRDNGSCKVLLTKADKDHEECMKILRKTDIPKDAVSRVSSKEISISCIR